MVILWNVMGRLIFKKKGLILALQNFLSRGSQLSLLFLFFLLKSFIEAQEMRGLVSLILAGLPFYFFWEKSDNYKEICPKNLGIEIMKIYCTK
ncbi:MAG: hypothetical protein CM15mP58_19250 [Burkholderiaceae bacterium]|nr:MAG: hypothetical protein CM15mP58_19250 [Burkholderiaceae bacterium]